MDLEKRMADQQKAMERIAAQQEKKAAEKAREKELEKARIQAFNDRLAI